MALQRRSICFSVIVLISSVCMSSCQQNGYDESVTSPQPILQVEIDEKLQLIRLVSEENMDGMEPVNSLHDYRMGIEADRSAGEKCLLSTLKSTFDEAKNMFVAMSMYTLQDTANDEETTIEEYELGPAVSDAALVASKYIADFCYGLPAHWLLPVLDEKSRNQQTSGAQPVFTGRRVKRRTRRVYACSRRGRRRVRCGYVIIYEPDYYYPYDNYYYRPRRRRRRRRRRRPPVIVQYHPYYYY